MNLFSQIAMVTGHNPMVGLEGIPFSTDTFKTILHIAELRMSLEKYQFVLSKDQIGDGFKLELYSVDAGLRFNLDLSLLKLFQICKGVKIEQYVNLGDMSAACLTNPSSCGTNGGTLSFWVKHKVEYSYVQIIGTTPSDNAGFAVWLHKGYYMRKMK